MRYKVAMKPSSPQRKQMLIPLLMTVTALIPVALISYAGQALYRHQVDEGFAVVQTAAEQVYQEQVQLIASLEQLVTTISQIPAIQQRQPRETEQLLSRLVTTNYRIASMMISDLNGTVWASTLPHPPGLSLSNHRYFRQAVANGAFSSGEFAMGKQSVPSLGFASPIKNAAGTITDVIVITVPLNGSHQLKQPVAPPVSLRIDDHQGIIIHDSDDRNLSGTTDQPSSYAAMTALPAGGCFEERAPSGRTVISAFRTIKLPRESSPFLYIRATLDKTSVVSDVYHQMYIILLGFVALLALTAIIIRHFRRRWIATNVTPLQETVTRLAKGEYSPGSATAISSPELGEVVQSFDNVAQKLGSTMEALQRSDAALKESEKNYRELVQNAQSIILKMDNSGAITFFNEYAETYFGFSHQEILGKNVIGTIVPPTESSGRDLKIMIARLLEHPSDYVHNINENMRKTGERVWVSWNNHPLFNEQTQTQEILCIGQDITERRTIEQSLRLSEQRYRTFVENANDVVFALTPSGIFSYVSPQWKEAFGYEIEETIGQPFAPFVHPDDVPGCIEFLKQTLLSEKKQRGVEYRVLHKNGSWRWYTANGSRVIDQEHGLSFIGIGRDITDHKQLQEEQLKLQKLESLGILAAGIAHNFNNALTGVIGYISFAKKHLKEPDTISSILEAAEKSSHRAANLARQLLTFAKGNTPSKSPHDPFTLLQEAMNLFLSGTSIKGSVTTSTKRFINVDEEQFHQVFNNIIINAVHAMPNGGELKTTISDYDVESNVPGGLPPGSYVQILFTDCGYGIAPEDIPKIFDPYFTTRASGTGLGLSTTHSIITRHEGRIAISSEVGIGTTVTIVLPAYRERPMIPVDDITSTVCEESAAPHGSVLIMDDEEDIRELAVRRLSEAGYVVQTCCNGEEAVEIYREILNRGDEVPVVILDLSVRGSMGGSEAAKQILTIDPAARLIISSGYSNDPIMAEAASYGFCASLPKPYPFDLLLQTLQRAQRVDLIEE